MRMFPPEPIFIAGKLEFRYHDSNDEARFLLDIYPELDLNRYVGHRMDGETLGMILFEIKNQIMEIMWKAGYRW